ncbi:MAG: o-succinylbenzoate synthase [Balneolaceae bacterium]|nr:o-succinylbenzoate synthase [Balneolaceae bacterium]MCH8548662.1 o-succinylbenzoate synthase [Balneolaceae bacterium]
MLELYSYKLQFHTPLVTGKETYRDRSGYIVRYSDGDTESLSEIAPLPGFSPDSSDEVYTVLERLFPELQTILQERYTVPQLKDYLKTLPPFPSLRFGLSSLSTDIYCKRGDISHFRFFNKSPQREVYVNQTIGADSQESIEEKVIQGAQSGYRVFKLKAKGELDSVIRAIRSIISRDSSLSFRIDANGSLTATQFRSAFNDLEGLPIEYIEEPVPFSDIDEIIKWSNESPIPVAIDESIGSDDHLDSLMSALPDTVFIIKPMALGNLLTLYETISARRSRCMDVVVTTTLESAVGRSINNSAAAVLGDAGRAHGLGTGSLFKEDLTRDDPALLPIFKPNQFELSPLKFNMLNRHLLTKVL